MTKYKLDKQVQERLDIVNELNIKIEEMSPNEARQIPWTAGDGDEIPDVGCVVEIGADGPFGPSSSVNSILSPSLRYLIQAALTALA